MFATPAYAQAAGAAAGPNPAIMQIGLLVGMVDTPMSARWEVPKVTAASVVSQAYDGVANGAMEILADETTRGLKSMLSMKGEELYPKLHEQLAGFKA